MSARHGELVEATIAYLFALGHYPFPVPNRGVKIRDKRTGEDKWIRGKMQAGVADVIAAHCHGRGIACEIKITPDTLRPDQLRFKAEVERRGWLFYEVRDDTQTLLDAHKRGEV